MKNVFVYDISRNNFHRKVTGIPAITGSRVIVYPHPASTEITIATAAKNYPFILNLALQESVTNKTVCHESIKSSNQANHATE
jgi:hypothetical protein